MPYLQFTSVLRLVAGLNGLAALILALFSLGVLGGDVEPPDLFEPMECFLLGFGACSLALLWIFLAQLWRERRQRLGRRPGGHLGIALAMLAFVGGVGAFGMGCLASINVSDDGGQDGALTVYTGKPLTPIPRHPG